MLCGGVCIKEIDNTLQFLFQSIGGMHMRNDDDERLHYQSSQPLRVRDSYHR